MPTIFQQLKTPGEPGCTPCIDPATGKVTKLLPFCFLDTATVSYQDWLVNTPNQLANLSATNARVAIVGAGPAGLSLGFQLLRAGCRDFTIFEATDRIGGRFYSYKLDAVNMAELGAMRFPPTENCLYWYIQYLQTAYSAGKQPHAIKLSPDFPDPGLVPTLVSYRDRLYTINPGGPTPAEFKVVSDAWQAFTTTTDDIVLGDGTTLSPPAAIMGWLNKNDPATFNPVLALNAWQAYLNVFKDSSFEKGIIDIFCQPNAPGGVPWSYPGDLEIFGTVGTGIGGYSPLFEISFCELMRFIFNKLEDCHAQIVTGTDSVMDGLADCVVNSSNDTVRRHIRMNTAVADVVPSADGQTVALYDGSGTLLGDGFTHLVVATTHNAAQIDMNIDPRWQSPAEQAHPMSEALISMDMREAISNVHLAQSSKFFIKVTPWWRGNPSRIRCITTDTPMENFYTLDYSPASAYGVCLMNYVWEDVSEKAEALGDLDERYQRFRRDLVKIAGNAHSYILESMPDHATSQNAVMIDWQKQPHYYGAFMLNNASQEYMLSTMFYDFLSDKPKAKIYFIGDSFHHIGGWVEGAFQTALNAFCAIATSVGSTVNNAGESPLLLNPHQLIYDNPPNNAMSTSFGPHGGIGGPTNFSEPITSATPVVVFSDQNRIRGIRIDNKLFGDNTNVPTGTTIPSTDLQALRSLQVVLFTSAEFPTGRLRCLTINGTTYGASPQPDDIPYAFASSESYMVSRIMGASSEDVDRIGFVIARKPSTLTT